MGVTLEVVTYKSLYNHVYRLFLKKNRAKIKQPMISYSLALPIASTNNGLQTTISMYVQQKISLPKYAMILGFLSWKGEGRRIRIRAGDVITEGEVKVM